METIKNVKRNLSKMKEVKKKPQQTWYVTSENIDRTDMKNGK